MSKVAKKEPEKLPLTKEETAYNEEVKRIVGMIHSLYGTIKDSYKPRTFEDINGKSVYGPNSANKSEVGKLVSLLGRFEDDANKYLIGNEVEKRDSGFSSMNYMAKEIAPMVGLAEGTPLWPQGQYPVLSLDILVSWTGIYVYLNNLQNTTPGKKKLFRCDAYMRKFIGQFHGADAGKRADGTSYPPFNLDEIDFSRLRKIYKKFKLRDEKGELLPINIQEGSELDRACNELKSFYEDLKNKKAELKKKLERIGQTKEDLQKARTDFAQGLISQAMISKNENLVLQAEQDYQAAAQDFIQSAANMGIVKHE